MGASGGGMSGTQKGIMKRQYSDKKGIEDYLMSAEQNPRGVRQGALGQLAGIYGLEQPAGYEGQWGSQQGVINQAQQSPLYGAIMGNWENSREQGEDAIMRNAAATGGLRSGNIQSALYDYNTRGTNQAQNQALLASYSDQMQGLTGLSNTIAMPSQLPNMYGSNVSTQGPGRGDGGMGLGGLMDMGGSFFGALSNSGGAGMGAGITPMPV